MITDLAPELLQMIFDYLEFIDKMHFRQVNTYIYNIVRIIDLHDIDMKYIMLLNDDILKGLPDVKYLNANYHTKITDDGIKHLNLQKLYVYANTNITNDGIKNMQLKTLLAEFDENITNDAIKDMTSLKELYISYHKAITDDGLKNLNLEVIESYFNPKITKSGLGHMSNLKVCKIDK